MFVAVEEMISFGVVHAYAVDVARRCVRVRLSGVLTSEALLSTFIDLQRDARITHEFCALIDLRDVRSVEGLHNDELRSIASTPLDTVARRAFVAVHPAVFRLCRTFAVCRELAEREPVAVFRSIHDAEEWLGLPGDV
jgi:hypothetical protein